MNWTREAAGWVSRDKRYLLAEEENPWWWPGSDNPRMTWTVRVGREGARRMIWSGPTLDAVKAYAEHDVTLPVFDSRGECRWCHIEKAYLEQTPPGWFGCDLCTFEGVAS